MTVDWLTLELYVMGELPPDEAEAVEQTLAIDEESRTRLASIRDDQRELPPFPEVSDEPVGVVVPLWRGPLLGAIAALAAGMLLIPLLTSRPDAVRAKGGELSLLVEDEAGRQLSDGEQVPVGTRIQVRASWEPVPVDATLRADGEVVWQGVLEGGNRERVPGAWRVERGSVRICLEVEDQQTCVELDGV